MDPVSRILEERERALPGFAPWIVLAVALHLSVVATVFALARLAPARRVHLPTVAVRLVKLPATRPGPAAAAPAAAAPAPTPIARPKPTAATAPTAAPRPRPTAPTASEHAMAAPGAHATPVPEAPAPPAGGVGGGLSVGAAAGEGVGVPADFPFTYYIQRMLALIESHWYKPPAPTGTRARVRFTILRGGQLTGIALEESSGVPAFDRAALRALYAANPLPPLPFGYGQESLTIHLAFSEAP